jgi:hypothetical protein
MVTMLVTWFLAFLFMAGGLTVWLLVEGDEEADNKRLTGMILVGYGVALFAIAALFMR